MNADGYRGKELMENYFSSMNKVLVSERQNHFITASYIFVNSSEPN